MILKNKFLLPAILLTICIAGGSYYPFLGHSEAIVKPVIHYTASYPAYETEELTEQATTVIHGVVRKIGKTEIQKVPLSTEIDITDENKGRFVEIPETPVYITVKDSLKQQDAEQTEFVFKEEGGELQKQIIEPDGGFLKVGDEVVIFLNESGHSWGSMGVLKVTNDTVKAKINHEFQQLNLEVLKERIRKQVDKSSFFNRH